MPRSKRYRKGGPLQEHGGIISYQLDMQAQMFTPKEARAEYARLRREANRRMEVLQRSEFAGLASISNRPGSFGALPAGASESQVRKQLYDVARFLNLRTSSLKGARAAQRDWIESMHGAGYDFVNKQNAVEFAKFLGEVQQKYGKKTYSSNQIATLYETAKTKRVDVETVKDRFAFWMEHKGELEAAPRSNATISAEKMAERIGLTID